MLIDFLSLLFRGFEAHGFLFETFSILLIPRFQRKYAIDTIFDC